MSTTLFEKKVGMERGQYRTFARVFQALKRHLCKPSRGDACWFKVSGAGKRALTSATSGDVWGSAATAATTTPTPPPIQESFYVLVDGVRPCGVACVVV